MFYDKYLELCKQKDIAPSRAAEEAGFSKSLVSKWKSYDSELPSIEILGKISDYFGISISELLEEKEQPIVNLDGLSKNRKALVEYALTLTEDQARQAYRILKAVVEGDL